MLAATAEVRRTLPTFRHLLATRPSDIEDYWLKVGFPRSDGETEYLWLDHLSWNGDSVTGVLQNDPEKVPGRHAGDQVTVKQNAISDWAYLKHGQAFGNFTTRVLLRHASPEIAKEVSKTLSPEPLEPGRP